MDIVSQTLQAMIADDRISKIAERIWLEIASSPPEGNKGGYPIHKVQIMALTRKLHRARSSVYIAIRQLERAGYLQNFRVGNETHFILRNGQKAARG